VHSNKLSPLSRLVNTTQNFADLFCSLDPETDFSLWWTDAYNTYFLELHRSALGHSNELTKCWTELLFEAENKAKTLSEINQYKQILLINLFYQDTLKMLVLE
jgi:hypothetical protein